MASGFRLSLPFKYMSSRPVAIHAWVEQDSRCLGIVYYSYETKQVDVRTFFTERWTRPAISFCTEMGEAR